MLLMILLDTKRWVFFRGVGPWPLDSDSSLWNFSCVCHGKLIVLSLANATAKCKHVLGLLLQPWVWYYYWLPLENIQELLAMVCTYEGYTTDSVPNTVRVCIINRARIMRWDIIMLEYTPPTVVFSVDNAIYQQLLLVRLNIWRRR